MTNHKPSLKRIHQLYEDWTNDLIEKKYPVLIINADEKLKTDDYREIMNSIKKAEVVGNITIP